jgi:hypothetical protein
VCVCVEGSCSWG